MQHFDRPANAAADPHTPAPAALYGTQHAAKYNRNTPDEVLIFLALFRVAEKNVDLVLTFNVPVATQDDGALGEQAVNTAKEQFETAVRSLKIVDMSLFV